MKIIDKTKCCGCSACEQICPTNAIKLSPDEEGFLYPNIDGTKCIECELCYRTCPIINKNKREESLNEGYIIRNKNQEELRESTSGGFFSPLCKILMNDGVHVYAATYDLDFNVVHKEVDINNIKKFRGSKYVQSNLNDVFFQIKVQLEKKEKVCFVGTPCQVSGLKKYIGSNDNLLTIDLVCHGVPSPKLWRKYLDYQEQKYGSKITDINFRNKTYGYQSSTMKIKFLNNKFYYGSARVDLMLKSFFSEICSRPICYSCPFKISDRDSDITIFDSWNASKINNKIKEDDLGYTNIIIHSEKGVQIFNKLKEMFYFYKSDVKSMINYDGSMFTKSAVAHIRRNEFYKNIDNENLKKHINRFIPITFKDYFLEKSKKVLYLTGLLRYLKKIKEK